MLALQTFILQQGAGLVAEVGAAQTVQRAMVEHPFDLRVQRMSCKVMKLLAEEEENVVLLAGFGSVRLVIAALQRFGHDVEIQRCGSAAMHFLTVNRDSRIQCSSSGGPNTLHQTLSKYSSTDKVGRAKEVGTVSCFFLGWSCFPSVSGKSLLVCCVGRFLSLFAHSFH